MTTSPIDPNRLLLTGENPYIRLSVLANPVFPGRAELHLLKIFSMLLADRDGLVVRF